MTISPVYEEVRLPTSPLYVTVAFPDEESRIYAIPSILISLFNDTVIAQVAVKFEPSVVVAVIVAVPLATAVTRPVLLTVATAVLLLCHITLLSVALLGVTVALSCNVFPLVVSVAEVWLRLISCMLTSSK